uniref:PD-(D/E)XK nuclease superfamily protein n=1 Tax=viral metagenome TaxID=1070528 RepID=A0A6H2A1M9_9ZZZZ
MPEIIHDMPSVTRIISPYVDYSQVPSNRLEQATQRGKDVHSIIAAIALNLWVPKIPEECKGYVESFKGWFDKYVEQVVYVEHELVDTVYRFYGHIDFYGKIKKIGCGVIDWKTPILQEKAWRLQMAGYERLVTYRGKHIDVVASLQLDPNGRLPKMTRYEGHSARDFNIFLGMLNAYYFFKE